MFKEIYLSHERVNLVLGCCECSGCAHARIHDLGMNVKVLKQVFKLPHCGCNLCVCMCVCVCGVCVWCVCVVCVCV